MRNFEQFINYILIDLNGYKITILNAIILTLGIIGIFILNRIIKRTLNRNKLFNNVSDRLKKLISRLITSFVWIAGILLILRLEHINTKTFFAEILYSGDNVTITVQKIVVFFVVIILVRIIVLVIDFLMNRKIEKDNLDYGKGKSVLQIAKYFIWIVGVLIAIGTIGLELTFVIASVSALLVGVGFGLQYIFNDFFSGIIILFDGSIKVNDIVQVGDVVGEVKEIGIRTTKVLNRDNIILIIPNSKFTTDNVINWSHLDKKSRFNVAVGVAYGSDVKKVEELLLECATELKEVDKRPTPFVRFEDFGESSLDFRLFFWTNNSFTVENIKSDLRFTINQKFKENNITIPFPQRDLHFISDSRNK